MNKLKEKMTLNPIMTFIILIISTFVVSGILSFIGVGATYSQIDNVGNTVRTFEKVESLFNLDGLRYLFTNTVSNFALFAPLIMLIIVLFGIGIMEKSGFLKTAFTVLTKRFKKNTITFIWVFICIIASVIGDLAYVILIPLSALLWIHGKRNPLLGIVATFAALTCGSGLNVIFTSIDSTLLAQTLIGASIIDSSYVLEPMMFILIKSIGVLICAILVTRITEGLIATKMGKYEFEETLETKEIEIEDIDDLYDKKGISKEEKRGLLLSLLAAFIYIVIFAYNIIPGLPLSGNLLDSSQNFYIDKLFSVDSFFSQGFVFIITLLFVVLGLFYGIGAKTIKNNKDISDNLGHSLDGIGKPITFIFFAATFISLFKYTNIGVVITAYFAEFISTTSFQGLPLVILLFIVGLLTSLVLPSPVIRWSILSGVVVPVAMIAGISPEFAQVIFRFSDVFIGLTPLFAYFIIYLAYMEKYNQEERPFALFRAIKMQLPYSLTVGGILLALLILWYLVGLPIGIEGSAIL